MTKQALVLARGLGRRMRQPDAAAHLTVDQRRAADAGVKAMMPIGGRPFLDFVLSSLADAGIADIALVVAPEHERLARYYTVERPPERVRIAFVIQQQPAGTADAVLAAEERTGGEPFLTVNADNLFPSDVLRRLAALDEPGLAVFGRDDLVRTGNIPDERVQAFALVDVDRGGYLRGIVEKPSSGQMEAAGPSALVSMNCWRFDARIFAACRDVPRSARGEYELPEAVGLALERGVPFRGIEGHGPVLDLSRRADAADVARRLSAVAPRP